MCAVNNGESEVIGFILFGGVFPNARIQQVAVAKRHQRTGVASALINLVVSQLEMRGYLTITAAIASELTAAQAFYERNGYSQPVCGVLVDRLVIAPSSFEREI